jgi:hypothetical protein
MTIAALSCVISVYRAKCDLVYDGQSVFYNTHRNFEINFFKKSFVCSLKSSSEEMTNRIQAKRIGRLLALNGLVHRDDNH